MGSSQGPSVLLLLLQRSHRPHPVQQTAVKQPRERRPLRSPPPRRTLRVALFGSGFCWASSHFFACCGCGGVSTVSSKQACEKHNYDRATCLNVGCCSFSVLGGCRAKDKEQQELLPIV